MAVADAPSLRDGTIHSADGTQLVWRSWEVERPRATFAVVHGHGDHSGRYERFARAMAGHGFSTFAVDLRGHGRSEGQRGHVDAWSDWLKDAETFVGHVEQHPSAGEVIPVGHSFGGVVVLSAVLHDALQPRRFVVSNPALRLKMQVPGWKLAIGRFGSRWLPKLAQPTGLDPAGISREPEVVAAYKSDPLVHGSISSRLFMEWIRACEDVEGRAAELRTPFFLSLGDGDPIIDHQNSLAFAERAVNAPHEVRVWDGRYHEPFNDLGSSEVFDAIAAWIG